MTTSNQRIRNVVAVLGAAALLLGAVGVAGAAPPVEPVVTLNLPVATCVAEDEVEVTGSVVSNVALSGFNIHINRYEDVTAASPDVFDRFDQVEWWGADFWQSGKKGPDIPTTHTVVTGDSATWSYHGMMDGAGYDENLSNDLFVVGVNAWASGKGNTGSAEVWDEWVFDCQGLPTSPTMSSFTSPWDAEWTHEQGGL